MSNNIPDDDKLLAIESSYGELTHKFTKEGFSPYACAAVMVKLAFMIYKNSMNAEEYNLMIDSISDSRDKILSFEEVDKTNRLN